MKQNWQPNDTDDSQARLAKLFAWTESSPKVRLAVWMLVALCAALFLVDFVVHRHAYAPKEDTPGFYALTGFLVFSFAALLASVLRRFVWRSEDYYAPQSVDAEAYPEAGLARQGQNLDHEVRTDGTRRDDANGDDTSGTRP